MDFDSSARVESFAFGSCNRQGLRNPFWEGVVASDSQFFLWLGDNIYADTEDPVVMARKYERQASDPRYRSVVETMPVDGVWDDHDFATNNAVGDTPVKVDSQRLFLDFLGVAQDSPRRTRAGTYSDRLLGPPGAQVHLVLLDTRYHQTGADSASPSLLGEAQWTWLEQTVASSPAQVLFIVSSISVLSPVHNYIEEWGEYGDEQARLLALVAAAPARKVAFLTGDRHFAGVLRSTAGEREVVELMSSGMTHAVLPFFKPFYRATYGADAYFFRRNRGQVRIDWTEPTDPRVSFEARDRRDRVRLEASF